MISKGRHVKRFAIIGCGTAGLATAIHLARAGHEISIFERFSEPAAVGAGILIQPSGAAVLHELGLLDALSRTSARIEALDGRLPNGKRIMDVRYRDFAPDAHGLGVHRANLLAVLHGAATEAGAHIHCSLDVRSIEKGPSGSCLMFADGSRSDVFDAVIVANGTQSRIREQLPVPQSCKPYPWGALWAVLPLEERDPLPAALVQRYHRASVMIGLMPTGTNPVDSRRCVSFFWSLKCTDVENWKRAPLEEWKREALGHWPEIEWALERITTREQLAFASYADVRMQRWHHENIVILGDAAHGMSPQLGQGANLALIDAACLSDCIAEFSDIDEALAEYTRRRRKHLHFYQRASRWLTPLFQSDSRVATWARDLGFPLANRFSFLRREAVRTVGGLKTGWLFDQAVIDTDRVNARSEAMSSAE